MHTLQTGLPTITALTQAMNKEVERLGGMDEAIAACNRMYSADFRSEPEKLSSVSDWEDETTSLKISFAVKLYSASIGQKYPPEPDFEASDHECDSFYYEMEAFEESAERWFDKQYPNFVLTGDTLIVHICNYKGEGGGIELYNTHKQLPIFRSKRESFGQVNNQRC